MKFRIFLKKEIERLMIKHNLKVLKQHTKIEELNKRIRQLHKLTYFVDDKHITFKRNSARLWLLEHRIKSIPKCKLCETKVNTFRSIFCSPKCQKKHFDLTETEENKSKRLAKASASRDYDAISKKGHKSRKDKGTYEDWKKSISIALNKELDNGMSIAQERGKTISESLLSKGDDFLKNKAMKSAETRKNNGNNSSKTFWDNLPYDERSQYVKCRTEKFRKTLISNGHMIHQKLNDQYYNYFKESSFKHGFKTTNLDELKLLKEHGIFHNKNNTKGCVRDHLLSRRYGFDNGIDPKIISHPANCEIVLHSENVRRCKTNDNQITYEELLERIEKYK